MNPVLTDFIVENYVDNGRRLKDKRVGPAYSFAVWVPGAHETRRF